MTKYEPVRCVGLRIPRDLFAAVNDVRTWPAVVESAERCAATVRGYQAPREPARHWSDKVPNGNATSFYKMRPDLSSSVKRAMIRRLHKDGVEIPSLAITFEMSEGQVAAILRGEG